MARVRVYGYGRSGRAYTARLRAAGHVVAAFDREGDDVVAVDADPADATGAADLAVLSLPRGTDSARALETMDPRDVPAVYDLTTQSPDLARRNADAWRAAGGAAYHAGGSNGGARAVRAGEGIFLIGPRPAGPVAAVVSDFGTVRVFDTIEKAVTLKLFHNAFLIVENEMARVLADLAARRGIALGELEQVVSEGPAGRPFGALTAIRHLKGGYPTSYIGTYAAKDWGHFIELLRDDEPELLSFVHDDEVTRRLTDRGDGPWV